MNSRSVTGADARPSVVPLCGMPLRRLFTSEAPGNGVLERPDGGHVRERVRGAAAEDDGERDADRDRERRDAGADQDAG